jgi:hypothetical protein
MRARPPGAAMLLLSLLSLLSIVAASACTRENPGYRGPGVAAQTLEAGALFETDGGEPAPPDAGDPELAPPDAADDAVGDPAPDAVPDRAPTGVALLIVGDLELSKSDVQLEVALSRLGYAINLKLDVDSGTADAGRADVVIISGSTWPDDVSTKFVDVPVPVVVFDEAMFPTMKMTGPKRDTDFGILANVKSLTILDPTHPLAAGLSGTVDVSAANILVSWGVPAPAAVRVASQVGDPTHITTFGYQAGDMMVGMPAPSRRVGSFVRFARNTTYTEAGLALFEAAVLWATGRI